MPLSKVKNRERMREARRVQPKAAVVQPKVDALQLKSKGTKQVVSSKPPVQPNVNRYLTTRLSVCPDYDVIKPGDHWETCKYINPLLR